jgi:hypothetical protein
MEVGNGVCYNLLKKISESFNEKSERGDGDGGDG